MSARAMPGTESRNGLPGFREYTYGASPRKLRPVPRRGAPGSCPEGAAGGFRARPGRTGGPRRESVHDGGYSHGPSRQLDWRSRRFSPSYLLSGSPPPRPEEASLGHVGRPGKWQRAGAALAAPARGGFAAVSHERVHESDLPSRPRRVHLAGRRSLVRGRERPGLRPLSLGPRHHDGPRSPCGVRADGGFRDPRRGRGVVRVRPPVARAPFGQPRPDRARVQAGPVPVRMPGLPPPGGGSRAVLGAGTRPQAGRKRTCPRRAACSCRGARGSGSRPA